MAQPLVEELLVDEPESREEPVDDRTAEDDADATPTATRYSVSYYGIDFDVDGLVKRWTNDIVKPKFQRQFVWTPAQCSRFVESLLLGLPVPGIFLYREPASNRMQVVDGLQRILTIVAFKQGLLRGREFRLHKNVVPELVGRSYDTLEDPDRRLFDFTYIHATVIRQDSPEEADPTSIYQVFDRLNTGGTVLSPMEIRQCVSYGEFTAELDRLQQLPTWRRLYGAPNHRGKEQEIILRFAALYLELPAYDKPMRSHLDKFVTANRDLAKYPLDTFKPAFEGAVWAVVEQLGRERVRPRRNLNVALLDAVLVGTARRLESGPITDTSGWQRAHDALIAEPGFRELFESQTTDTDRVGGRIERYEAMLAGLA